MNRRGASIRWSRSYFKNDEEFVRSVGDEVWNREPQGRDISREGTLSGSERGNKGNEFTVEESLPTVPVVRV